MTESTFWYIGYGSLMNRRTRGNATVLFPIYLSGYQRSWSYRSISAEASYANVTALNIEEDASAEISAVLVQEPLSQLASLDAREGGYDRLGILPEQIRFLDVSQAVAINASIYIYRAKPERRHYANVDFPILQSYLDVVVMGTIEQFSIAAAEVAVRDCIGLDREIVNDREAPIYPRAQHYDKAQLALIDAIVAKCRVI